ncbi:MAG: cobalamin B12-binding domain-containing protein [candidate division WOR-3 bacterium]
MTDADQVRWPSESAVELFRASLAATTGAVARRLEVLRQYSKDRPTCADVAPVCDLPISFGRMLLAVYELKLYNILKSQCDWYASVMARRGLGSDQFREMLEVWEMAIMANIRAPESTELVRPLVMLRTRLDRQSGATLPGDERRPQVAPATMQLVRLLLKQDRREAANLTLELTKDSGALRVCEETVFPALAEVGWRWQSNQITVADEHAATDIARYIIFRLFDEAPRAEPVGHSALIACVPNEEHELGAEVLANYLELMGWTTWFIGHSAPQSDLVQAAKDVQPYFIFLAVTLIENLPDARVLIDRLHGAVPASQIVLGGYAAIQAREAFESSVDRVADSVSAAAQMAIQSSV